jgi:cytochrome c-type biogenesis protein CcmE
MNIKIAIAVGLLAVAGVVGLTSFKKTMTPYITFREARTANGLVQVSGTLASKDYTMKQAEQFLRFQLKDTNGDVMSVVYRGTIPGNFDQAVSIVAIGEYRGDHFEANKLLVKCPSKYQAMAEEQGNKS